MHTCCKELPICLRNASFIVISITNSRYCLTFKRSQHVEAYIILCHRLSDLQNAKPNNPHSLTEKFSKESRMSMLAYVSLSDTALHRISERQLIERKNIDIFNACKGDCFKFTKENKRKSSILFSFEIKTNEYSLNVALKFHLRCFRKSQSILAQSTPKLPSSPKLRTSMISPKRFK